MNEELGKVRESTTGYGKIWNEDGNTFYKAYNHDAVQITQQNLDDVAKGKWTNGLGREVSFDGARTDGEGGMNMIQTRHGLANFLYTVTDNNGQQTIVLELVNE
jgi:hypothetical protein